MHKSARKQSHSSHTKSTRTTSLHHQSAPRSLSTQSSSPQHPTTICATVAQPRLGLRNKHRPTRKPTTLHTPSSHFSTELSSQQTSSSSTHTPNGDSPNDCFDIGNEEDHTPQKFRFPIPPQKLYRLPHQLTFRDQMLSPLQALNPKTQIFPDYAMLMDFQEKESLLGWKIITDAELNGTSEASIAWGTAKNPVTGEQMRTLVFQGRIGNIILPNQLLQGSNSTSAASKITSMFKRKETTEDAHGNLLKSIALDPNVDFGDNDDPFAEHDYGAVHGFVGLMSPVFIPPLDLSFWDTFNICVKTDGGPWLASMKPHTATNSELFMAGLPGPGGKVLYPRKPTGFLRRPMRNLFIPIDQLSVTRAGKQSVRTNASTLHPFHGFGFSIRGPPGPFKLEIGWIAVANSAGRIVAENTISTPSQDIHVELTPNLIDHTATMNDEELFAFTNQNKQKMDALAKTQSILVQESTGKNVIDTSAVINVEQIGAKELSETLRKKILAQQLGVSVGELGDLPSSLTENVQDQSNALDKSSSFIQKSRNAIDSMANYLSSTRSRADRLAMGLDPESVAQSNATIFFNRNAGSTLNQEEELFKLQREARRLTGSDTPLILPTYHDPSIMAQARLGQLQRGHMTEDEWIEYTTTNETIDLNKKEKQLQELDRKVLRQAFESAWSETSRAETIRRDAAVSAANTAKDNNVPNRADIFDQMSRQAEQLSTTKSSFDPDLPQSYYNPNYSPPQPPTQQQQQQQQQASLNLTEDGKQGTTKH